MDFTDIARTFDVLRLTPPSRLTLLEARTLASAHVPPFPPDIPALLTNVDSPELASHLQEVLSTTYPKDHLVQWVIEGKMKEEKVGNVADDIFSNAAHLYIPALAEGTSFESFVEIIAHLRAPNGCPWDREQTHETLRKHLLEESYEAVAAIDSGNFDDMREEFGDLLLQAVLQSQIANEEGQFNIHQAIHGIYTKLVRRHPHVFGDVQVDGVGNVLANWEKLKEQERGQEERG